MAVRLGLPPSAPAKALRQRRDRLAEALRAARLADTARASAEAAGEARSSRLRALREALGDDGAHLADDRLPPVAERMLDALRDQKAAADGWSQARRTIDTLKQSETIAADQLAEREAALAAALAGHWCAGHDALRLLKCLPDLESLADLDEQRVQLKRRIATMEEAIAAYQPMAAPLLDLLALPAGTGPADLLPAARKRAGEAEEAVRSIKAEKERLDRAEQAIREARIARPPPRPRSPMSSPGNRAATSATPPRRSTGCRGATTCGAASPRRGRPTRRPRATSTPRRWRPRRRSATRSAPTRCERTSMRPTFGRKNCGMPAPPRRRPSTRRWPEKAALRPTRSARRWSRRSARAAARRWRGS